MNFRSTLGRSALILCAAALAPLSAQAAPEQLIAVCQSCHGPGGAKPIAPNYPILAGQHANYLKQAMEGYRSGERKNAVMSAQAAALSDDDVKALALYFSQQDSPLYTPSLGDMPAAE